MAMDAIDVGREIYKLNVQLAKYRAMLEEINTSQDVPRTLLAFRKAMAIQLAKLKYEGVPVTVRKAEAQAACGKEEVAYEAAKQKISIRNDIIDVAKAELSGWQSYLRKFEYA